MKLLTRRALIVLVLALLVAAGLLVFTVRYLGEAPSWAQHASNRRLYSNGQLKETRIIYDRNGKFLFQAVDGVSSYNENQTVRLATMQVIGDGGDNVVTGARMAFRKRLTGWNLLTGAYRFNGQLSHLGGDLKLTIDADLCATAYNALNGRKGTVGVFNYKTGEILCMVSSPSFDPEYPPDVEADPERYEGVYLNRLFSGLYTPGSVFKLVTAAAALDNLENVGSKTYHCDGKLLVKGELVTCPSAHGDVTLEQALAKSCNVTFAQITLALGGDILQQYADKAGFNSSLRVNGIKTAAGRAAVQEAQGGDLAWAGIGQSRDLANPLNFMAYVGAIANDGQRVAPRILKNNPLSGLFNSIRGGREILSPETALRLRAMMRNNVLETYGEENYSGLELCAKSGTAQVGEDKEPHAWFTGFLDREDCPLAFVVVVENGGGGARVAGPVAAKVLRAAVGSLAGE